MTAQLSLNLDRRFPDLAEHVEKEFLHFHASNPHVYQLFKRFAYQVKMSGRKKYSAAAIVEQIRWHIEIETNAGDFKINNDFRACLSRELIAECPEFKDFFELRHSPKMEVY